MKKSVIPFFFILLLFSACARGENAENIKDAAYRLQDNLQYFINTPMGEYYMNPLDERGMIYFSEHGKHEFYLLCNKPDCSHSDENCNAYAGIALGYYNNHLYSVCLQSSDDEFTLVQMNMDGSEHKKICSLPEQHAPDGTISGGGSYGFHNGFLLYELLSDTDANLPTAYYKIELESGKTERLFEEETKDNILFGNDLKMRDNQLYFCTKTAKSNIPKLLQGNLETGTAITLIDDFSDCAITNIDENTVYYFHFGLGFCEYDINSKTETVKLKTDYPIAQVTYTDDYIFAKTNLSEDFEADWVFCVYDRDYHLLNQTNLGSDIKAPKFMYVTDEVIYFSQFGNKLTHYIKIKNIEKDLTLVEMTDPYALR